MPKVPDMAVQSRQFSLHLRAHSSSYTEMAGDYWVLQTRKHRARGCCLMNNRTLYSQARSRSLECDLELSSVQTQIKIKEF